jgi:uncharacterized phage protein (TIGR02218 family)
MELFMRNLDPAFAAHLASGATTLARCWKLTRRDGAILGFTDHDQDLTIGGTTYLARTGLDAAETTAELGFAIGGGEVAGALISASLLEADILAGLYDNAAVEIWLVNWSDVTQKLLLDAGVVGEVKRTEHAFTAELRSLASVLDESVGRLYRKSCSADLGDGRCGVSLAAVTTSGTVSSAVGRGSFASDVLGDYPDGYFTGGLVTFTSGANSGLSVEIRLHYAPGGPGGVDLWVSAAYPIAVGDAFSISAGCDKSYATCNAKFANGANFRGFPTMPGNDHIAKGVTNTEPLDGGSLFA